jgi:hypothetical protein
MWAINKTFHMTLKASPAQLAFNRDMILPMSFAANWYTINNRKQAQLQSAANAENFWRDTTIVYLDYAYARNS